MPLPKDKTKIKEWKEKISNALKGKRCSMRSEFGKGHIPHNKGTIGLMKANKTSFKKGNIPNNYMGGMKLCRNGIYILVKSKAYIYTNNKGQEVYVGKYENLARKKYREAHGEFDKGMKVLHIDGDMFNNNIDNLKLITKAELLKRNQRTRKLICNHCGKEFLSKATYIKYCSEKCYNEHIRLKRIAERKLKSELKAEKKAKHLNSIDTYK